MVATVGIVIGILGGGPPRGGWRTRSPNWRPSATATETCSATSRFERPTMFISLTARITLSSGMPAMAAGEPGRTSIMITPSTELSRTMPIGPGMN